MAVCFFLELLGVGRAVEDVIGQRLIALGLDPLELSPITPQDGQRCQQQDPAKPDDPALHLSTFSFLR